MAAWNYTHILYDTYTKLLSWDLKAVTWLVGLQLGKLQRRTENDFLKKTLFLEIPATEVSWILYAALLSRVGSKWNDQWFTWESHASLMYSIPDEISSLATKMVIFKVRLLCGKGSVQTAHLLYEKGGGFLAPSTSKQEHFFNRALFVFPVLV